LSVPVTIRGVAHRYTPRGPVVIHDLSLDVPAGGLTTVLGPSGSGKSTLLGLIAGIESPTAGDILFDGVSVVAVPSAKRGVALVLQQPHLFPYLSVGDNVTFGLAARGVRRATRVAEADRWLALVGLDGMAGRRPRELSGGEQQRVALVRALATEPRVLLLDEPLASLDPRVRVALQTLLRELVTETGVTTLMVTHDLSEAMSMGERTALLLDGHLVADEASQSLFLRPPNRVAAEFVGISSQARRERGAWRRLLEHLPSMPS
jgi:ABC-type Fe3+/spermidine/putrescine transport system ATPase subunit